VNWLKDVHTAALEERAGAKELLDDVITLLNDGLLPDGSTVTRVEGRRTPSLPEAWSRPHR
jgi:hypothetical protein